ncbi:unnamed protein product, partial [Effrenium voratum]
MKILLHVHRSICVVCRRVRGLRAFHCKLCGHCVQRLDHHCPWMDRCIGLQNQRSFYIFLLLLAFVMFLFLQLAVDFLQKASLGSSLGVVAVLACDGPAMFFVAALLLRQTAYMVANVTTYEILVCPPHISKRFPRRTWRLWYLQDLSWKAAVQNVLAFWS